MSRVISKCTELDEPLGQVDLEEGISLLSFALEDEQRAVPIEISLSRTASGKGDLLRV